MASSLPPGTNIAALTAPMLFGHLFNYGCFGMLTLQVVVYQQSFPADSFKLKAFVYGLYAVECAQVAVSTHDAYEDFAAGWGNIDALNAGQLLWLTAVFSAIVSAAVQCFYAWRIYHLSGKIIILSALIVLVSLMQASGAIASGVISHLLSLAHVNIEEATAQTRSSTIVWRVGTLVCDLLIACSMICFLSQKKQGIRSTDAILSRIITLTLESGAMTATVDCIDLALFLSFPLTNYHFAPALVLSKLYSNSFMMLLNSRVQTRNMLEGSGGLHTSGGQIWFNTSMNATRADGARRTRTLRTSDGTRRGGSPQSQEFSLKRLPPIVECEISTVVERDYDYDDSESEPRKHAPYSSEDPETFASGV
ncbi:hypothetical protein L226DRAFT_218218 [Lentinus tigrinus ALCF2SS1-7]|uniref:DUF6534 domain-containing protein n=1 Tax=Lentinus tigrinus ALCF2SS1-6 TaxID=1328759 RepID=A0A5C2S9K4_9APHY|nr:hypothetical protein L227DRAFT_101363 [Lentinus tigrinus ALCF2SS1-6]RPD70937.1 hypothetical protein L226DRAFT_218218 [Lentinus tigrinus ALCF2SS1-7]